MAPADQGLGPAHLVGPHAGGRLEVEQELVTDESRAQIAEQGQMGRGVHVEFVGVDDDLALRLLGRVHGHVGPL